MKDLNCPYIKISEKEAREFEIYSNLKDFSLVAKAEAQGIQESPLVFVDNVLDQLSFPFYILFASFFIFILLMSFVYYYHWKKFTMNDPFINSFIPIYFFGLFVLILPILYNLFA